MDEILDFESNEALVLASKGQRFANYMIDGVLVPVVVIFGFMALFGLEFFQLNDSSFRLNLQIYGIYIVYYTLMESSGGRTFGKMITKTHVVNEDGTKASFGQCLGRSFIRLVPFEALSFLGDTGVGWHDRWSKTRVVVD